MRSFLSLLLLGYPSVSVAENFDALETFSTIRTVAGTGLSQDGNFWSSNFEGADPRQVELSNPTIVERTHGGGFTS
ncbi:hypothetical protein N9268_00160 [Akkermansiaceae bacterium]|nr:hypothetical protein [Akkermansiaceae bacterium]MDB4421369.1 hypothetical protein [Akkermansiaceae bacterium]MDB4545884.1 hypothetical protein [Akkermansiaceae bacterium]